MPESVAKVATVPVPSISKDTKEEDMRPDHSPETAEALREPGCSTILAAMDGAIQAGADPHNLPPIKVEGGEGLTMFKILCRGALDEGGHR